jgi:type IV pilus assembly protein PilZ
LKKSVEQRFTTRIPIRIIVEYASVAEFLEDYTSNLSLGGMFIKTDHPLDVGTRFRLRFRVPGRTRPVETYGEVRWVEGPPSPGMGVAFDDLGPTDLRDVEAWLAQWDPG